MLQLPDGRIFATWISSGQDGSGYGIYGRFLDADANPIGDEFQINSHVVSDQIKPVVELLSDGSFVVAWEAFGLDDFRFTRIDYQMAKQYGVFAQKFDTNGTPLGAEFQVNTLSVGDQTHPQITALEGGGFLMSWRYEKFIFIGGELPPAGLPFGIRWRAQYFDDQSNPVGEEFNLNTGLTALSTQPWFHSAELLILPTGRITGIATSLAENELQKAFVIPFNETGKRIGDAYEIGADMPYNLGYSGTAILENGGFVVAFKTYAPLDGQATEFQGIHIQQFNAKGKPIR